MVIPKWAKWSKVEMVDTYRTRDYISLYVSFNEERILESSQTMMLEEFWVSCEKL